MRRALRKLSRRSRQLEGTCITHVAMNGQLRLSPSHRKAAWKSCNVLNFEEQVDFFEFAVTRFGRVDVVVSLLCPDS
jgi:NAD(P)-dependent dehydrogenase (short-subunit alcohol dehydrogenase family)